MLVDSELVEKTSSYAELVTMASQQVTTRAAQRQQQQQQRQQQQQQQQQMHTSSIPLSREAINLPSLSHSSSSPDYSPHDHSHTMENSSYSSTGMTLRSHSEGIANQPHKSLSINTTSTSTSTSTSTPIPTVAFSLNNRSYSQNDSLFPLEQGDGFHRWGSLNEQHQHERGYLGLQEENDRLFLNDLPPLAGDYDNRLFPHSTEFGHSIEQTK